MRKLLTILTISVITTSGTVNMVGCYKKNVVNDYDNLNLQNDMISLTKIASKVSSVITDYDNNGNVKDSNAFPELTAFYDLVNKDQSTVDPPGLTAENFVTAYKKSLPIFNVDHNNMMLAKLNVNLNYISLYGLPLVGALKINNQTFESNILISRQGLENKLINFGKIIVAFHQYYNIELKKRVLGSNDANNFKNSSVFHVGGIFTEFKNNISSANEIFKKLLTNFKRSQMAKELPDLGLFNMYNLVKDKPLWIGGQNDYESIQDKIVFNFKNGSFCLAFAFGQDRINSIFYTAYGSNAGDIKVQHGWWAWILINK